MLPLTRTVLSIGRSRYSHALLLGVLCVPVEAQTAQKAQPQTNTVSFTRDVVPILTERCIQCHGREPFMANLDLRTRTGALKGAQHGPAVVPGDAAASHLYRRLLGQDQPPMPLAGRLKDAEIDTIRYRIVGWRAWDAKVTLGNAVV